MVFLIVEPDDELRSSLERVLGRVKFEVVSVTDAEFAWQILDAAMNTRQKVDQVICDYDLPGMSGFEFLRRVRADARTAEMPFALTSSRYRVESNSHGELRDETKKLGATFWLKPYQQYRLIEHLVANMNL